MMSFNSKVQSMFSVFPKEAKIIADFDGEFLGDVDNYIVREVKDGHITYRPHCITDVSSCVVMGYSKYETKQAELLMEKLNDYFKSYKIGD